MGVDLGAESEEWWEKKEDAAGKDSDLCGSLEGASHHLGRVSKDLEHLALTGPGVWAYALAGELEILMEGFMKREGCRVDSLALSFMPEFASRALDLARQEEQRTSPEFAEEFGFDRCEPCNLMWGVELTYENLVDELRKLEGLTGDEIPRGRIQAVVPRALKALYEREGCSL